MTPERWQKIEQLAQAAMDRQPNQRQAFLAQACHGDDELRREVESLLAQEKPAESFLESVGAEVSRRVWAKMQGADGEESMIGRRLGSYQVVSLLGAGGMGEVYLARDTKLGRDVAVKVLPAGLTHDADRLARFQREARLLAALNHANIATIHGLEQSDSTHYLVMELVPGETLAERISKGAVPPQEALKVACQIAEALEAAHEKGIVHRDLKPANVKLTPEGRVKVLDFGLAKALSGDDDMDLSKAPTLSEEGRILGTPAYMSPEQARGKPIDKRTDIWAFGCVLFEMLSSRPVFKGDTISDTIAAILEREPAWDRLPDATPQSVHRLLRRCLDKDIKRRLRDIGDARVELEELASQRPSSRRTLALVLVVIGALLAGGTTLFYLTKRSLPPTSPSEYVQITNFTDAAMAPSLSPDGRMVTFKRGTNTGQAGQVEDFLGAGEIYVKLLPNGEAVQLTHGPGRKYAPVFTPDGSRIAYTQLTFSGTSASWDTWTIPVLGGEPTLLLPNASGLTWVGNRRVLFSEITTGLHMGIVTATETRAETRVIYFPAHELGMAHYSYVSPDLKSVVVIEMANTHAFDSPCRLIPFDGSSAGRQVGPAGTCLSAAWSPDGKWMYFSADVEGQVHLWRQRFPTGTPEQITFGANQEQGIAVAPDGKSLITSVGKRVSVIWLHDSTGNRPITLEGYAGTPRVSGDGKHVFYLDSATSTAFSPAGPAPAGELRSVDVASGKIDSALPGLSISDYDISPDGRDVVFTIKNSVGPQIWLAPLDRRSSPQQITDGDQVSFGPHDELFFRVNENNTNFLYRINRDGTRRERVTSLPILIKYGVSPDGEWVIAAVSAGSDNQRASDSEAVPFQTVAVPVHGGGPLRRICGATCPSSWSSNGRFFYVQIGGRTRVFPVASGRSLPNVPVSGLDANEKADKRAGTVIPDEGDVSLGADPSVYAFRRTELRANLFRIPIH